MTLPSIQITCICHEQPCAHARRSTVGCVIDKPLIGMRSGRNIDAYYGWHTLLNKDATR